MWSAYCPQEHDVLHCRAAFQPVGPQYVLVHAVIALQIKDFAISLAEIHGTPLRPACPCPSYWQHSYPTCQSLLLAQPVNFLRVHAVPLSRSSMKTLNSTGPTTDRQTRTQIKAAILSKSRKHSKTQFMLSWFLEIVFIIDFLLYFQDYVKKPNMPNDSLLVVKVSVLPFLQISTQKLWWSSVPLTICFPAALRSWQCHHKPIWKKYNSP